MFDRIFANYLLDNGKLTLRSLGEIYSTQEQRRVRIGVIAISEQMMTIDEVDEVIQLQAIYDKRFGELAIMQGFLTEEQVAKLLILQGNPFVAFEQAVIDSSYMTITGFNSSLDDYQNKYGFSQDEMEDLKSCDLEKVVPIFTKDMPPILKKLAGIAIRSIYRLVDYHMYVRNPKQLTSYDYSAISYQSLVGEHSILTAFCGDLDTSMVEAGMGFAGKENIIENEDALDAMCELANCINGLFATELSHENIDIDMEAPYSSTEPGVLKSDLIYCVPFVVCGAPLDLVFTLDSEYTL